MNCFIAGVFINKCSRNDMVEYICVLQSTAVIVLMTSRAKGSQIGSVVSTSNRKNLQKSLQQQVYSMQIHNIEAERLRKTFHRICGNINSTQKDQQKQAETTNSSPKDRFNNKDIIRILTQLKFPINKPEIDQWIWEIDEDLDGCINQYEFTLMYKRCIFDKTGLEPRNLFNLTQFLMYDLGGRGVITVEDTLQLIYVRHPEQLQEYINDIFEQNEKTADGQDREILFEEYLSQMRKYDLKLRKKLQEKRKTVNIPKKKSEED